jgi:hypothetical protein
VAHRRIVTLAPGKRKRALCSIRVLFPRPRAVRHPENGDGPARGPSDQAVGERPTA